VSTNVKILIALFIAGLALYAVFKAADTDLPADYCPPWRMQKLEMVLMTFESNLEMGGLTRPNQTASEAARSIVRSMQAINSPVTPEEVEMEGDLPFKTWSWEYGTPTGTWQIVLSGDDATGVLTLAAYGASIEKPVKVKEYTLVK